MLPLAAIGYLSDKNNLRFERVIKTNIDSFTGSS